MIFPNYNRTRPIADDCALKYKSYEFLVITLTKKVMVI